MLDFETLKDIYKSVENKPEQKVLKQVAYESIKLFLIKKALEVLICKYKERLCLKCNVPYNDSEARFEIDDHVKEMGQVVIDCLAKEGFTED